MFKLFKIMTELNDFRSIKSFLKCLWEEKSVLLVTFSFILKKNKFVAYSSQGNHIGQLDSCNWLADGSTTG